MSPRSQEFLAQAKHRLQAARHSLKAGDADVAASAAYYALLYAARAALSERDRYAKTHSGTWTAFHEVFVASGEFDAGLAREATRARRIRELGDYEALPPTTEQAEGLIALGARFLAAIEEMLAN